MVDILDVPSHLSIEPANPVAENITETDRHVGAQIRRRRLAMGLSQQELAEMIGITYQQAHKYERATNRISAGRLFKIAEALGTPIAWFFEGLQGAVAEKPAGRASLELARNFQAIENAFHRDALNEMAKALALQSIRKREGLPE